MLEDILTALPAEQVVAFRTGRAIDVRRLRACVTRVASELVPQQPSHADNVAFAFGRDRFAFTAALFGAWSAGHGAVLPADSRRELVAPSLRMPGTGILLHDTGVGRGLHVASLVDAAMSEDAPDGDWPASFSAGGEGVALTTLGHNACRSHRGRAHAALPGFSDFAVHMWSAEELRAELEHWERALAWPKRVVVVTTVAPSSLPGLLLGVLLPLRAGTPFSSAVPRTPEDLVHELRRCDARVLVTSGGHLRRILELPVGSLAGLERVYSTIDAPESGLSDEFRRRHGLRVDTVLERREPSVISARARELEAALLLTPGIEDSIVLEHEGCVAVCVQTRELDRAQIERALGAHGARLPEHMAIVERLPRDPNGSVPPEAVWRHFGLDANARTLPLDFEWSARGVLASEAVTVTIPAQSAWFRGHFPETPVLAGAVQLQEIVMPALRRAVESDVRVSAWSALKFLARILPGDSLVVQFTPDLAARSARFSIRRGTELCTSGSLEFEPVADGDALP